MIVRRDDHDDGEGIIITGERTAIAVQDRGCRPVGSVPTLTLFTGGQLLHLLLTLHLREIESHTEEVARLFESLAAEAAHKKDS